MGEACRVSKAKLVAADSLVATAMVLRKTNSNAELCLVDEAVMLRRYEVLSGMGY